MKSSQTPRTFKINSPERPKRLPAWLITASILANLISPSAQATPNGCPRLLEPVPKVSLSASVESFVIKEKIRERSLRIQQRISENYYAILSELSKIESRSGAEYEIRQALRTLQGFERELQSLPNAVKAKNVVVYGATNVPLYTLILHAVIPSFVSEKVWFRTPLATRGIYARLFELLSGASSDLHSIHLVVDPKIAQYDQFRKSYVLGEKTGRTADAVVFTGNPETGRRVLEEIQTGLRGLKTAGRIKFLGFGVGMNPLVVTETSGRRLEAVVDEMLAPIRINSGQDCIAPNFYVIHDQFAKSVVTTFLTRTAKMRLGVVGDLEADYVALSLTEDLSGLKNYRLKYRKYLTNPDARFDVKTREIEPHVFVFPVEMFGSVDIPEHYAPFISIFVYKRTDEAAKIFQDPRVLEKRMYAAVFGDVDSASTKAIVASAENSGHETLVNKGLFEAEDGNLPFGGKGRDTSIVAEIVFGPEGVNLAERNYPILVSREILAPAWEVKLPNRPPGVRYVGGESGNPISFGIEIEFNVRENPNLVDYYRIPNVSETKWRSLGREAKIRLSTDWEKRIYKDYKAVAYVRLRDAPVKFPEQLLNESNGNVEMNGLIFDTVADARAFLVEFESLVGKGALQGHVVAEKSSLPGLTGYTVFKADENQLKTLEHGYARYLKNPGSIPGKSITHHSLAPLYQEDIAVFRSYEEALRTGGELPHVADSKHLNAPVMRGGGIYGKSKMGFEGRQFHRRSEELIEWQDDLSRTLEKDGDLSRYEVFSDARQIQNGLIDERLRDLRNWEIEKSGEIQRLRAVPWTSFQNKVAIWVRDQVPHIDYGARDTGLRMFFPLRPWADHPILTSLKSSERDAIEEVIHRETLVYIRTLEQLSAKADLPGAEGLKQIQVANAKWAHGVRLSRYFDEAKKTIAQAPTRRTSAYADASFSFAKSVRSTKSLDGAILPRVRLDATASQDAAYLEFLDETVEVLYEPNSFFGHISLRVGRIKYSLGNTNSISVLPFSFGSLGAISQGAVYRIGREKIGQVEAELQSFYRALKTDLPPFDAYSRMHRVDEMGDGRVQLSVERPGREPIRKMVPGRVNREGRSIWVGDGQGHREPVILKDGSMWIRSYSCTSSTTTILKGKFQIPFEFDYSAKNLIQSLTSGNPRGRLPDALIDYR